MGDPAPIEESIKAKEEELAREGAKLEKAAATYDESRDKLMDTLHVESSKQKAKLEKHLEERRRKRARKGTSALSGDATSRSENALREALVRKDAEIHRKEVTLKKSESVLNQLSLLLHRQDMSSNERLSNALK